MHILRVIVSMNIQPYSEIHASSTFFKALGTRLTLFIDPMHKWRQFKYSFVYIQISLTSLILGNIFF